MKKLILALVSSVALVASGAEFRTASFLTPELQGGYTVTNAAGTNSIANFTNALWGGIVLTNSAGGGRTNLLSWNNSTTAPLQVGTNGHLVKWTNNVGGIGIFNHITNGVPATDNTRIKFWQGPDRHNLLVDVPLPVVPSGAGATIYGGTNNWDESLATTKPLSTYSLSIRISSDAGIGYNNGNLNLLFVGLPDGVNEPPDVAGTTQQRFIWGVPQVVGTYISTTNFPLQRFLGCKAIRLRNAWIGNAASSNNQATVIQLLTFNGVYP